MRKPAATKIALLTLMLVVSHIALISHVTAHFEPELEQCELCVSQAQLVCALPAPDQVLTVESRFGLTEFAARQCNLPQNRCLFRCPRAPPTQSA